MTHNAKVIVTASTKGGEGKSSIISNLGAFLAVHHKKVLFIDLDYQSNLSSCFNQVSKDDYKRAEILRAYKHDSQNIRSPFPKDFQPAKVTKYVDLFTANRQMINIENLMRNRSSFAPYVLLHVFSALNLTKKYDYILLDCHNSFNILTKGAMVVSDYILTPVNPGRFSLDSVRTMIESIKDLKANLINPATQQPFVTAKLFLIGDMVDFNTRASHQFEDIVINNKDFIASFHRRELVNRATTNYTSVFKQADLDAQRGNKRNREVVDNEIIPNFQKIVKAINQGKED